MLRILAPQFEHRIFMSATPHNGHTRCFTGLLEILDPVRFSQTDELKPAERNRVQQIVLRRLKREINARTDPPRFCNRRNPQALALTLSPQEIALVEAFDAFRTAIRRLIGTGQPGVAGQAALRWKSWANAFLAAPLPLPNPGVAAKRGFRMKFPQEKPTWKPRAGMCSEKPEMIAKPSRGRPRPPASLVPG